jgi:type II secretory pathway pseudopilin PulG
MDYLDEVSQVVISWGHRLLIELLVAMAVFSAVHFLFYPIMQRRVDNAKAAEAKRETQPTPQQPQSPTITTGDITTKGNQSPVSIGASQPESTTGGKTK